MSIEPRCTMVAAWSRDGRSRMRMAPSWRGSKTWTAAWTQGLRCPPAVGEGSRRLPPGVPSVSGSAGEDVFRRGRGPFRRRTAPRPGCPGGIYPPGDGVPPGGVADQIAGIRRSAAVAPHDRSLNSPQQGANGLALNFHAAGRMVSASARTTFQGAVKHATPQALREQNPDLLKRRDVETGPRAASPGTRSGLAAPAQDRCRGRLDP